MKREIIQKVFCLLVISAVLVSFASATAEAAPSAEGKGGYYEVTKRGYYLRGVIPGWGQYYAGYHTKGLVFLGSFGLSGGVFTWSLFNMLNKKQAYDELGYGDAQSLFDGRWKEYKTASILALSLGIVMGAVYAASWVDLLFFSDYTGGRGKDRRAVRKVYFETYQYVVKKPGIDYIYGLKAVYTF